MVTLSKILDQIQSYLPGCNTRLVEKAYFLAAKVHEGQVRKSGDPYLSHPMEVAYILALMKLDLPTIAAGLLHDAVEDSSITLEEIKKEFGEEVAFIVDGVTKLKNLPNPADKPTSTDKLTKQAENIRKIILAMSKDLRVILVKLADRLHNMRTLEYQPEYKRIRIARETLEIYAPLAGRLGIDWVKNELEDLSFKYLYPEEYRRLKQEVEKRVEASQQYIEKVKTLLTDLLEKHGIKGRVLGRVKHLYSIYKKLLKYNLTINDLDQIYDIIGFRVIVNTVEECYKTLGLVHSLWPPIPGRFKDFISLPKPNMYQSLHTTVLGPESKKVEIQIRTEYMDKIANEGIAAHFLYKEGVFTSKHGQYKYLEWLSKLIELQKELKNPREFLESLKLDFFPDEIYVFTPKGDIITLPVGATPLDFAYAVHTEVGNKCVRAYVNDKLVSLDYKLQTGDVVKIETSPNQTPSRDWLKIVVTGRAKSRIKQWLNREERQKLVELGKELLNKEFKKQGLNLSLFKEEDLIKIPQEFKIKNMEDLYFLIGSGKITPKQILKNYIETKKVEEPQPDLSIEEQVEKLGIKEGLVEKLLAQNLKDVVVVDGADNVLFHLAKCCRPIPGDEIIGYITRGKGVSVHRADCPNLKDLDAERLIEVRWGKIENRYYPVHISIVCSDRKGLLANISSVIAASESNILKAEVKTTSDQKAFFDFYIEVNNKEHLDKIISNLFKINGVLSVERKLV
ncbi:bifunctional (p)ppGpp synthetase/guanosine-3',5'-bis(diphosphate) 3'-pyrophosphohydrolase [Thermodesulfobacterium sp. TA1]|uniref:RelA/SpoT family protein n=1 Tax=Thermodesulfobacterium sp. TA1 TaxID=2234087 RepID=UPI001232DEA5|nr:bifunctional (p)ppGpp synthetase/guanosine-3',5'-bis(diphosphate) 3'-pyrophosphohydrolase [Thermodesulfobacterium sp. TA1]QER41727.1 bifunctional (p)ppGpp synthetase/guanosine-3',5'-bis(diphosphate) 3'-pyrophosphohydrolase [Thermodesulfobacterium sp. TA1]